MLTLIAAGAFCPVDDLVDVLGAGGWRTVGPEALAQTSTDPDPAVVVLEDDFGDIADLLTARPSTRAILLHVSREEAVACALCGGIEPPTALERWSASALKQAALFRRMRAQVVLVPRRRLEAAPSEVLGNCGPDVFIAPWRVDTIALALASRMVAQLPTPDAAASMLAACIREEDRIDATLDAEDALAAWRRHATLAAEAEGAIRASEEAAAVRRERDETRGAAERAAAEAAGREQDLRDEIALLREQLVHMQTKLETTWSQREEGRAEAERKAQAAVAAAEARAAATLRQVEEAQAALASRDTALAERDEALKASQAQAATGAAELAKAREALADAMKRLETARDVGVEAERLRKIEASQSEEISLLREQLKHLQTAFETAWLQKEEVRATASRRPPVHDGLTMPVDLGVAAQPAP